MINDYGSGNFLINIVKNSIITIPCYYGVSKLRNEKIMIRTVIGSAISLSFWLAYVDIPNKISEEKIASSIIFLIGMYYLIPITNDKPISKKERIKRSIVLMFAMLFVPVLINTLDTIWMHLIGKS